MAIDRSFVYLDGCRWLATYVNLVGLRERNCRPTNHNNRHEDRQEAINSFCVLLRAHSLTCRKFKKILFRIQPHCTTHIKLNRPKVGGNGSNNL